IATAAVAAVAVVVVIAVAVAAIAGEIASARLGAVTERAAACDEANDDPEEAEDQEGRGADNLKLERGHGARSSQRACRRVRGGAAAAGARYSPTLRARVTVTAASGSGSLRGSRVAQNDPAT